MSSQPIGIFDSGVGGLTVVRSVMKALPYESISYLGDIARLPYGTKSAETVVRYTRKAANLLIERGVKLLVVACNTASAYALDGLQASLDVPVLGVIEPGSHAAIRATRNNRIGVIGTPGTIRSDQYRRTIAGLNPAVEVFSTACPLFVPLAEEGWTAGDVPLRIAEAYLAELRGHAIDTLVLGCTHYPLLVDVIQAAMGPEVNLIDSADSCAQTVEEVLAAAGLRAPKSDAPAHRFFCTDSPEGFTRLGGRFLGLPIGTAEWVDF